MSSWGPWSSLLTTLTLPQTAGPGDARIVIGPNLPPPLDTYLYAGSYPVNSAIIYYGGILGDNNYMFTASIPTASEHFVIDGAVVNGAVVENIAGFPLGSFRAYTNAFDFLNGFRGPFYNDSFGASLDGAYVGFDLTGTDPIAVFTRLNTFDPASSNPMNNGGVGTIETWHTAVLQNGWTGTLKYRRVASPPEGVQLVGNIVAGTKADGTTITQLPAGYRPVALGQDIFVNAFGGVVANNQPPHVNVPTTGAVGIYGLNTSTNANINGMFSRDL